MVDAAAPLRARSRCGCGAGALVVTYPAEHVGRGLGDTPEAERPLEATLWGEPRGGRALARLADGGRGALARGELARSPAGRDVILTER